VTRLYAAKVYKLFYWVDRVLLLLAMASNPNQDSRSFFGPRDAETELGSFLVHCCESGAEAFLLVNEQGDVVSIIDVRERMLADLDADSTTDVLHDEIHCTAEQGRRPDSDSNL